MTAIPYSAVITKHTSLFRANRSSVQLCFYFYYSINYIDVKLLKRVLNKL